VQGEIDYIWSNVYVHVKEIPVEIQNLTYWNLNGCRVTAMQLVLLSSSILRPYLYQSALITVRKNLAPFKMLFLSFCLAFFKSRKSEIEQLENFLSWGKSVMCNYWAISMKRHHR
jgi:hypothetical protein